MHINTYHNTLISLNTYTVTNMKKWIYQYKYRVLIILKRSIYNGKIKHINSRFNLLYSDKTSMPPS